MGTAEKLVLALLIHFAHIFNLRVAEDRQHYALVIIHVGGVELSRNDQAPSGLMRDFNRQVWTLFWCKPAQEGQIVPTVWAEIKVTRLDAVINGPCPTGS